MDWLKESHGAIDFGYNATESTKNRKAPRQKLTSEDDHLNPQSRRALTATTRDLRRNEVTARWVLGKHIDFVVKHNFQPNTGEEALDETLKEFYRIASRKENFDISGRHNLEGFMRILEGNRVIDGDVYCVRQRGGFIQAIESDRIRQPTETNVGLTPSNTYIDSRMNDWVQGVQIDSSGRHKQYAVHRRTQGNFEFERFISAKKVIPYGFWDRFDQTRGISPLASVINTVQDLNESYDYALAKAKVAQIFALAITREAQWGLGDDDEADGNQDPNTSVKLDKGAMILDLDAGEDAKFLTANTPEGDTQAFWKDMVAMVCKSLNIPYSFWDESFTNFNGSRTALILYLRSVEKYREDQVAFRNDWFSWRLKIGVLKGEIQLPSTFEIDPKSWLWIPDGLQYWDTMKEANADIALIENGLRSRTEIRRERFGDEWSDVAKKLAEEQEMMEELNILPPSLTPPPEPVLPEDPSNPMDPKGDKPKDPKGDKPKDPKAPPTKKAPPNGK